MLTSVSLFFFFPGVLSCSVLLKKDSFVSSYLTFYACFYESGITTPHSLTGVALCVRLLCGHVFQATWQAGLDWSGHGLRISQGVPGARVILKDAVLH